MKLNPDILQTDKKVSDSLFFRIFIEMRNLLRRYFIIIMLIGIPQFLFGQSAFSLGTVSNFVLFTSNGAISNTGTSNVTGDIGSDIGTISGFGAPSVLIGTSYNADAVTNQAKTDLFIAYNQLISIPVTDATHAPAFGGSETLTPGVYTVAGAGSLAGTLTLDGLGDTNSVFIFRFGGAYAVGASSSVVLINDARSCNIFWVAEGAIAVGASSIMKGTLLANNAAASAASGCDIEGRLLSTTGAIAFGPAIIAKPVCGSSIPLPLAPPCCNPEFGSTIDFVVFTNNGAVTNTGASILTENIGTDFGGFTGFVPGNVTGTMFDDDATTDLAKTDLLALYNQLIVSPVTNASHTPAFGSGESLTSGVYYIDQAASLAGNLTLDAQMDTNSIFIFKIRGAFAVSAASNVILTNLASSCSVFWVSEGAISIGAGSVIKGTFLANNAALSMGAGGDLKGRLFSTKGAIAIDDLEADNTDPCHDPTFFSPLPVGLRSFVAECESQNIRLEWSTSTEINNDYYTIENSIDGVDWKIVSTVTGSGNSSVIRHYSFIDIQNGLELSYYRLKQTDFDGGYRYYPIIGAKKCMDDFTEVAIYPNPANKYLNIIIDFPEERVASMSIYNQFGKIIYYSNTYEPHIDFENIVNGIYIMKLELDSKSIFEKFVILN
ncbi:MAG: hypothetical protein ACI9N1_000006 [Flavobacteriales bacterium]|jgi:hypothetical protein